jgi:hypothetical protein
MASAAPPDRFAFEDPAFRRDGARFERDDSREPVFRFDLGGVQASVPLAQLPVSLGLPHDAPDRRLLKRIAPALRYSRAIRPDDVLPSECIDGSPSWSPKPHMMLRAIDRLRRALGANLLEVGGPEISGPGEASAAMAALAAAIRTLRNTRGRPIEARDLAEVAGVLARVDWLSRSVLTVQQCVGELARVSAERANTRMAELARTSALGLRTAVVWATGRAMRADTAAADVLSALHDVESFNAVIRPQIATLRAFAIDVEPAVALWQAARQRRGGPTEADLEALVRLVRLRYANFEPELYHWSPCDGADATAGGFDA